MIILENEESIPDSSNTESDEETLVFPWAYRNFTSPDFRTTVFDVFRQLELAGFPVQEYRKPPSDSLLTHVRKIMSYLEKPTWVLLLSNSPKFLTKIEALVPIVFSLTYARVYGLASSCWTDVYRLNKSIDDNMDSRDPLSDEEKQLLWDAHLVVFHGINSVNNKGRTAGHGRFFDRRAQKRMLLTAIVGSEPNSQHMIKGVYTSISDYYGGAIAALTEVSVSSVYIVKLASKLSVDISKDTIDE